MAEDRLTPDQEAKINEYVTRWEAVGIKTGEADWATFEDAIPKLYKLAGNLPAPKRIVRVASPLVMALAAPPVAHVIAYLEEYSDATQHGKNSSGSDELVVAEIYEAFSKLKNLQFGGNNIAPHRYQKSIDLAVDAILEGLGCEDEATCLRVLGALRAINSTKEGVEFQLWGYHLEGQFGAAYCSYTSFLREVLNAFKDDKEKEEHSIQYERAMSSVSFWWPGTTFVIASDRPRTLTLDERGRPHSDIGQACGWSDGFGWYAIRGVEIPDDKAHVVTNPEKITADEIRNEQNLELRRIMVQRMGHQKYFDAIKAKVIDIDSLTLDGSACRVLMQDDLGEKWLVGTDGSTKRIYSMAVSRDAKTCKEAHEGICCFDETRMIAEA